MPRMQHLRGEPERGTDNDAERTTMNWKRTSLSPAHWGALLLLALLWLAGSSMDIQKYTGPFAIPALLLGLGIVALLLYGISSASRERLFKPANYVFVLLWLAVAVLYAVIHPISARHTVTQGNDSENALYLGATNLLHLHFPYYSRTYLNNPITPMPGALMLDTPFAGIGDAGLQSLFWLGVFIVFVLKYFRYRSTALFCLLLVLANAHTFVNFMTGADYPVNCLYVSVASFWFLHETREKGTARYWLSSLLLGLALSSRLTYLLIIPLLLAAFLWQQLGTLPAVRRLLQPLAISALVTIPFYLYDPSHFSPLHVANFLSAMTPAHQHLVFAALTGSAVLIALSGFLARMTLPRFYLTAALAATVILLPPGSIVALHQHFTVNGTVVLGYTDTAYIFLCLWACYFLEGMGRGTFTKEDALSVL